MPALRGCDITATYAGIRPATEEKDYRINHLPERHYLSVGGIRSTGLSGALGIARYVYKVFSRSASPYTALTAPVCPSVPNLAELGERDWRRSDNGGIVCHCEWVTRREIQNALQGPLAARSLAALKRRTRVTMGRCQGFYCSAELSAMTEGAFIQPLASTPTRG